jgi:hypothetical protein
VIEVPKLVENTPLQDYLTSYGLLVKREDLCAPPPWPPFSKTRGVYQYMKKLQHQGVNTFGVLDTYHSQGGLAVAASGARRGARVINYFPVYKAEQNPHSSVPWPMKLRWQQEEALKLGADLVGLKAGRSAVLFHQAKYACEKAGGHMYPNALKLDESVQETAKEVMFALQSANTVQYELMKHIPWIVPSSSATLASGVALGLAKAFTIPPKLIIHLGYSRSQEAVMRYVQSHLPSDLSVTRFVEIIDEGYSYKDTARPGDTPPWPCNQYYDLKAFRWWQREGQKRFGKAVFWNIG